MLVYHGHDEKDSFVVEDGKVTGVRIGGADPVVPFNGGNPIEILQQRFRYMKSGYLATSGYDTDTNWKMADQYTYSIPGTTGYRALKYCVLEEDVIGTTVMVGGGGGTTAIYANLDYVPDTWFSGSNVSFLRGLSSPRFIVSEGTDTETNMYTVGSGQIMFGKKGDVILLSLCWNIHSSTASFSLNVLY